MGEKAQADVERKVRGKGERAAETRGLGLASIDLVITARRYAGYTHHSSGVGRNEDGDGGEGRGDRGEGDGWGGRKGARDQRAGADGKGREGLGFRFPI